MLTYKKLNNHEAQSWNIKLQETNASYFQYPYYGEGHEGLPYSSVSYYELNESERCIGFATILDVNFGPLKIGLVTRGPVIFEEVNTPKILTLLKRIQCNNKYLFIRVSPNIYDDEFTKLLNDDIKVLKKDYFPIYRGSQDRDFIIENIDNTEESLLKSYKPRARQKIRFASEENFNYYVSTSLADLKRVYEMFMKLSGKKEFIFRSLNSYQKILEAGSKVGLAELHIIEEHQKIVNAVLVLKDKNTFINFSGGLISGEYRPRNSPGAFLHHEIIKKALIHEQKKYYNISYTSPDHPVYEFKTLFNPTEMPFPKYYTITDKPMLIKVFSSLILKLMPKIKSVIRKKHGNK